MPLHILSDFLATTGWHNPSINLESYIKSNKKGFYRYFSDKRKSKEIVGPLQKKTGDLVTQDMENAEVLSDVFALLFMRESSIHIAQAQGSKERKKNCIL